jgi:hypothetical protein
VARVTKPKTLEDRLDVYRALLRREPLPELGRLVDLLESELRSSERRRERSDRSRPR